MGFRTIVVKSRAKLEYKLGYLVVRNEEEQRVHISEIDTLIVESTGVACTAALLCELVTNNINVIFCDEKHLPHFYLSPFANHTSCSKHIRLQAAWEEQRKQLAWTAIIRNKLLLQKNILEKQEKQEEAALLQSYIEDLQLGDTTNREGHAAKVYFNALFGQQFSRRNEAFDINAKLNYGYAILLSSVSREIAAHGYTTQLGIWHKNEYNHYNLASDIMEPFRPIVDDYVLQGCREGALSKTMPGIMEAKVKILEKNQYFEAAIRCYTRKVIAFMEFQTEELPFLFEYEL